MRGFGYPNIADYRRHSLVRHIDPITDVQADRFYSIVRKKRERPTDRLSNEELDAKIPPSDDPVAWIDTTPRGQHATRLLSDHEH